MIRLDMGIVYTIINLIVLYLLLRHFLIGPVTQVMEKRKQIIEDGFKNAQKAQDDALRMKQEYEDALSGAKQESVQIVENARKSAKSEYDRIVGEAGEKAGSIIESAKETVRVERERTMKEMQSEIAGLAMASARKIIGGGADYGIGAESRNSADAGSGRELYDRFLSEMSGDAGEGSEDEDRK